MLDSEKVASPPQTVGPFFHDCLMRGHLPDSNELHFAGELIRVQGRITDRRGDPVDDAMLEVFHTVASAAADAGLDDDTHLRSTQFHRVATTEDGYYSFSCREPFPALFGHRRRVGHLNLHIFARGLLDRLSTRAYLGDPAELLEEADLHQLAGDRAGTLIASPVGGDPVIYNFDICLAGENETVFFEI